MNKNQITQDQHQGMQIIAFAIVSPTGPEDLPNDVPNSPEEEFPENEPDEAPEMPDQDDLGFDEEVGIEGENAFPEIDEQEIDDQEIGEQEQANDAEGLPVQPPTPPSDLDETTI